jgi:hypothetical protein
MDIYNMVSRHSSLIRILSRCASKHMSPLCEADRKRIEWNLAEHKLMYTFALNNI